MFDQALIAAEVQGAGQTAGRGDIPDPPPLSPSESLAMLHVRAGYRAELVAAEPLVQDPVAIDWGLDGSLWVAEMADYPSGLDGAGKPGGRIRVLRDTDGDGRYDNSTIFLDGLPFPNGILLWQAGVLITAAPEILYAADTDGDDRADVRETLYTGFLQGNQQLRVNGLRWGLDNWIYCASGSHHGEYGAGRSVTSVRQSRSIALGSRDFRIRPHAGQLEPESGPAQFGRNQNDWGDWFGVQNSYPLWHYVLADRYIRRNPYYAPSDPRKQLVLPANPKVYPAKAPEKRFHGPEMAGHFTSACSAIVYRDTLLPREPGVWHGFTCEPFHNLIQHHVITREGSSYKASRDPQDGEIDFFASRDHWCRPVMVRTGPDGSLWVVDMYRFMIEHPEWLPAEGKAALQPFYRSGEGMGRIYRVLPANSKPRPWASQQQSDRDLVALLNSSNGWLRDRAQQRLVERRPLSDDIVKSLQSMATVPSTSELAVLHALCTLDGTDQLDEATLRAALQHPHWGVRRQAVRIAEERREEMPWVLEALLSLTEDPDAAVRLQLACSLGEFDGAAIGRALGRLAAGSTDPYMRDAVMSSLRQDQLKSFVQALDTSESGLAGWIEPLGRMVAASDDDDSLGVMLDALLSVADKDDHQLAAWQRRGLAELADTWEKAGLSWDRWSQHHTAGGYTWAAALREARRTLDDADRSIEQHILAVRLLDRQSESWAYDRARLTAQLSAQTPIEVQRAIIEHLTRRAGEDVPDLLLGRWSEHSPAVRSAIVEALLRRPAWSVALLSAMADGQVAIADVAVAHRQRLLDARDSHVREQASRLFRQHGTQGREQLIRYYRDAAADGGTAEGGKVVFEKHCSACHRLDGVGNEIGPNLLALTDRSSDALLSSILDPNRAVEPQYLSYTVALNDGSVHTGRIALETATSFTLQTADGKSQVVLRSEVEEVRGSGKSLMPEGLEQQISPSEMADLLTYLQQTTPGRERVEQ